MKTIYKFLYLFALSFFTILSAQTYQLTGNPVNTTGWDIVPTAAVNTNFIQLTNDVINQVGGIKLNAPINLKNCDKWAVEFDFRIDGNGTYAFGDGIAFWYLANPPASYVQGNGLGIPDNATGLMVAFDVYDNTYNSTMSKLHILYGTNAAGQNIEFNNTNGSTFHSQNLFNTPQTFIGNTFKHVVVNGQTDPSNVNNWIIKVSIDGTQIVNQSFSPSGGSTTMTQGYFGFSASTGQASARQSIQNVKVYTDKIQILTPSINKNFCSGNNSVDLTSFNNQFSTNTNYIFTYYEQGNSTPIPNPNNYQFTSTKNIIVSIKDPSLLLCDNPDGIINLNVSPPILTPSITASNTTICPGTPITLTSNVTTGNLWSNGATTPSITVTTPGTYTLTTTVGNCTSSLTSITIKAETDPQVQIAGNLSFCSGTSTTLTASGTGTGLTYLWNTGDTTPAITVNTAGTFTVTVTTPAGCKYTKSVTTSILPLPTVQNANLAQCSTASTAIFDLTSAQTQISTTSGISFVYYVNQADAQAQNTNNITNTTAYSSGNATIYVLVKLGQCSKIAQLTLNVSATPTATITPSSTTICAGGSVTLTSSATTGNTWSNGETTSSITVTTPGTYTLTTTVGNCTSSLTSITIKAETDPQVQIAGNLSFCSGTSTTLTASGTGTGLTYLWNTGDTTPAITVNTAGTFTVTVTTPAGCNYTKSVTTSILPLPTVQNANLAQCSTASTAIFDLTSTQTQISTTSGVSFVYYVNQADAQAQNTNNITNTTAYSSGNATIYVLVKLGQCSKIANLSLTVNPKPVPTITPSAQAICDNSNVTLTSNYATGNTWSTGATTQSIIVTTPGTYSLTNSNGLCTSSPVSINVVANPNPNIQIAGNLTFCEGSSTILTASASGTGNTFTWSTGTSGANCTITTGGTYTVTVKTSGGCLYQKSVTVVMDPKIIINIATPQIITCNTPQITLNATASVYQPGATFLWTTTGTGNIVSGANTLTPVVNAGGVYTLKITSATPLGCSPQSSVTVIADKNPPTIYLSSPTMTICKGYSAVITANGAVTYTWTGMSGSGNTQTVSPTTTTTYTVNGIGANGCASTTPGTITIKVVPDITSPLESNVEICKVDVYTLDAGYDPTYSYLWNTGATTQKINVTNEGTYTVTIKNEGCSKSFTSVVKYAKVPEIKEVIYADNSLTIKAQNFGTSPLEYSIDNGVIWQNSNTFYNIFKNTLYSISVKNVRATCSSSVDYYTTSIQNTITPNFDGKNDKIDFSQIVKFDKFEGAIFDKMGVIIFRPSIQTPTWDGTYIGRPLPTDTYWYKFSWLDSITKKPVLSSGWIVVKNR